jgi:hypothetical protein
VLPTLALLLALNAAPPTEKPSAVAFPLEAGTTWVYEGTAQWTEDASEAREGPITLQMKVEAVREAKGFRIAWLRGWPADCAWYVPGAKPKLHAVVEVPGRGLFLLDESRATELKERFARREAVSLASLGLEADALFVVPGVKARGGFGDAQALKRADRLYSWQVDEEPTVDLKNLGRPATKGLQLSYRTNSDHQLVEFVPGVGITSYEYVHHGSVAECSVKLKQMSKEKP